MSEGFKITIYPTSRTTMLEAIKAVKYILDKIDEDILTNGWITVGKVQSLFDWFSNVEYQYDKDYTGINNFKDIYGWPVEMRNYFLEHNFNLTILRITFPEPCNLRRSKKVKVLKPEEDDMVKFYCDICGKNLSPSNRRYISISSVVNDVRDLALKKCCTYLVCETCGSKFTDILKEGKYSNEKEKGE